MEVPTLYGQQGYHGEAKYSNNNFSVKLATIMCTL